MKKFLSFLSIILITAFVFAACNSNPNTDSQAATALQQQSAVNTDTIGLSQFQAWKAQNELADVEDFNKPDQYAAAEPKAPVRKATKPYKAPVQKPAAKPVVAAPETATAPINNPTVSDSNEGDGDRTSESGNVAKAPEKKKISNATKGAVIGGVVGAVGGAIINKDNRVVGAVIGGVIGAGGGYGVGRGMDKRGGRFDMMP